MSTERSGGEKINHYYDKFVGEYFFLGSVDAVVGRHSSEGVSFAELHRQLDARDIVKLRSRHSDIPVVTSFFESFLDTVRSISFYRDGNALPLETFYKTYVSQSLRTGLSLSWLQKVYDYILTTGKRNSDLKREGTALIISHPKDSKMVLVCDELTKSDKTIGKWTGAVTFPMGYSPKGDNLGGITRVLQQEVFAKEAVWGILGKNSAMIKDVAGLGEPTIMTSIDIAHIEVTVHTITCPPHLTDEGCFSSNKVGNYRWVNIGELASMDPNGHGVRSGVVDMANTYNLSLDREDLSIPPHLKSSLNLAILKLPITPRREYFTMAALS